MKLLRLIIENFKCYGYADLDFSKIQAACIVGTEKNNENRSNGTGKSTIFEAIEYALIGYVYSNTVDEIVRFGQALAKVTVDFSLDETSYRVERSRNVKTKKSSLLLYEQIDGEWEKIDQKTDSETKAELKKLTKIDHITYANSICFSQENVRFLSATVQERKKIFKEVLGLTVYSSLEKFVKEDLIVVSKKISDLNVEIQLKGKPLDEIERLKLEIEKSQLPLDIFSAEKLNLDKIISLKNEEINILHQNISPQTNELNSKLTELRNSKRNLQLSLNNSNKTLLFKEKEYLEKKTSFEEKTNELKEKKEELDSLKKRKYVNIELLQTNLNDNSTKIVGLKSSVLNINNRLEEFNNPLPNGKLCPSCRQPLTEEHKEKCLIELKDQIDSLNKEKKLNENLLETCIEFENISQKELKYQTDCENKIVLLTAGIEAKKEDIKNVKAVAGQIVQMINKVKDDNADYAKQINELTIKEDVIKLQLKNDNAEESAAKIAVLQKEISSLRDKIVEIIQEVSKIETTICFYKKQIAEEELKTKAVEKLEEKKSVLLKEFKKIKFWEQGFHPNGIPTSIIHSILDDFQFHINDVVNKIRPEIEILIKVLEEKDEEQEDTIDFQIKKNGQSINYNMLSNGQKFTSNIAFQVGFKRLMETRLGIKYGFVKFDEIDRSLDKESLENFVKLITDLQVNDKVFVITHNDWFKDKFSHVILVEYDEELGSTATLKERN